MQYRMSQGIMDLSNALIYGDKLRCGSSDIADAKLKFSSLKSGSLWINEVRAFSSIFILRWIIFLIHDVYPYQLYAEPYMILSQASYVASVKGIEAVWTQICAVFFFQKYKTNLEV